MVLNGPSNLENRRAIERFGRTRVVAELEPLDPLSRETVARAASEFDRDGGAGAPSPGVPAGRRDGVG